MKITQKMRDDAECYDVSHDYMISKIRSDPPTSVAQISPGAFFYRFSDCRVLSMDVKGTIQYMLNFNSEDDLL